MGVRYQHTFILTLGWNNNRPLSHIMFSLIIQFITTYFLSWTRHINIGLILEFFPIIQLALRCDYFRHYTITIIVHRLSMIKSLLLWSWIIIQIKVNSMIKLFPFSIFIARLINYWIFCWSLKDCAYIWSRIITVYLLQVQTERFIHTHTLFHGCLLCWADFNNGWLHLFCILRTSIALNWLTRWAHITLAYTFLQQNIFTFKFFNNFIAHKVQILEFT